MVRLLIAVACLAISGCSTLRTMDRDLITRFSMTGPGHWEMTAGTAANYPIDSEKHEAIRLGWIEDYIRANGCTTFEVHERVVTRAPTDNVGRVGFSKNVGSIRYTGTCK